MNNGESSGAQRQRPEHTQEQQIQEYLQLQHYRFVASLERHGGATRGGGDVESSGLPSSRAAFSRMAAELGWQVEQVETYAYRYMVALLQAEHVDDDDEKDVAHSNDCTSSQQAGDNAMNGGATTHGTPMNGDKSQAMVHDNNILAEDEPAAVSACPEWTLEEDILFDSLLAIYLPEVGANRGNKHGDHRTALNWEEEVASRLPGRTPMEVRQRYTQLYGDKKKAR